jgi:hypothetical protein
MSGTITAGSYAVMDTADLVHAEIDDVQSGTPHFTHGWAAGHIATMSGSGAHTGGTCRRHGRSASACEPRVME